MSALLYSRIPHSALPHPDANVCTPASRIPMQMSALLHSRIPHSVLPMQMSALLHPEFRTPDANVCTPALPHSVLPMQMSVLLHSRIPFSRCKCLYSCTPASRYNSKYWMNNLYNKIILRNLTAASTTRNGGTAASACRRPKAWQARYLHGKRTIHYLNQTFDNYVHTQNGRTRHQRKASHVHHP